MSSWYYEGPDGRRFNWAKVPTFRCPVGRMEELPPALSAAASALALDPEWMLRRLKHSDAGRRRDANERLTDLCGACGAQLERLGFHCWVDRPQTRAEREADSLGRVSDRLNRSMGFGKVERRVTERSFYVDTKAKARRWAERELAQAKAVA